jgi:hypothetical protein
MRYELTSESVLILEDLQIGVEVGSGQLRELRHQLAAPLGDLCTHPGVSWDTHTVRT